MFWLSNCSILELAGGEEGEFAPTFAPLGDISVFPAPVEAAAAAAACAAAAAAEAAADDVGLDPRLALSWLRVKLTLSSCFSSKFF